MHTIQPYQPYQPHPKDAPIDRLGARLGARKEAERSAFQPQNNESNTITLIQGIKHYQPINRFLLLWM